MMRNLKNIVRTLDAIDKSKCPQKEIRETLTEGFSSFGILTHTLHETYRLVRLRRNMNSERFTSLSELSYKPKERNQQYQKANIPNTTLFYASSCERRDHSGAFTDEEYGIKVALFETLYELRDNCLHGYGLLDPKNPYPPFKVRTRNKIQNIEVTYGIWEVADCISLASVCLDRSYDADWVNYHTRQHIYNSYVMGDPMNRTGNDVFLKYLSHEFSKLGEPYRENYDYMVSAIAAQILCGMGFDGVSYPSTRCDGKGINFAIKPETVDSKLECTEVGLIRVNNEEGELNIKYENKVKLKAGSKSFDL